VIYRMQYRIVDPNICDVSMDIVQENEMDTNDSFGEHLPIIGRNIAKDIFMRV